MWVDTYSYVRLHQPHRMFTAADIRWELVADPAHLATKTEVLDQMQHCLDEARKQVTVEECFGWEFASGDEADDSVLVTCKDRDGRTVVIETDKVIKAYGHDVAPDDPLELSSKEVRSVSPDQDDLMSEMEPAAQRHGARLPAPSPPRSPLRRLTSTSSIPAR